MVKLNVKNGTPIGSAHLCKGCTHCQFIRGYRESETLVICNYSNQPQVIPFVVHECTEFWDRQRPDWEQMEKLALDFTETKHKRISGFRGSGFARVLVKESESEDVDETEDENEYKMREVARS